MSVVSLCTTIAVGTIVYKNIEHNVYGVGHCGEPGWPKCGTPWGWFQSFYFSVISTMSVGYGDFVVSNTAGRIFCMFYIVTSVMFVTAAINAMIAMRTEELLHGEIQRKMDIELSADMLFNFDADGDDAVDKYEFVAGVLDQLG
jgi:hypothetical protein